MKAECLEGGVAGRTSAAVHARSERRRTILLLLTTPLILTCGSETTPTAPVVAWTKPVPKATCGANDRVEPGLQGQTSLADRMSGASETAYNCNLELVGQYQGQGAEWQLTWFNDCAYYGTYNNAQQTTLGTVVLDVSNPASPQPTTHLQSRAMIDPWESLKVNEPRKLLGATKGPGFGPSQPTDRQFAIYDISADCKNPVLLSDVDIAGHTGHAGNWAPDGMTYYGGYLRTNGGQYYAVDTTDPTAPKLITRWTPGFANVHGLSISDDGNRGYFVSLGTSGGVPGLTNPAIPANNGLLIYDISQIQDRVANPQVKLISTFRNFEPLCMRLYSSTDDWNDPSSG